MPHDWLEVYPRACGVVKEEPCVRENRCGRYIVSIMKVDMLRVRVKGVALPSKHESPVVILQEDGGLGECVVAVGASEAGAILMELEGLSTPRPLTHELVAQMFKEQGISIRRVELYGLYGSNQDGYLARIAYSRGLRTWVRDVRPSDALALALASNAPVFAHQSLVSRPETCWITEIQRAWPAP